MIFDYNGLILWVLFFFILIKEGIEVLHFVVATYVLPTARLLAEIWHLLETLWK